MLAHVAGGLFLRGHREAPRLDRAQVRGTRGSAGEHGGIGPVGGEPRRSLAREERGDGGEPGEGDHASARVRTTRAFDEGDGSVTTRERERRNDEEVVVVGELPLEHHAGHRRGEPRREPRELARATLDHHVDADRGEDHGQRRAGHEPEGEVLDDVEPGRRDERGEVRLVDEDPEDEVAERVVRGEPRGGDRPRDEHPAPEERDAPRRLLRRNGDGPGDDPGREDGHRRDLVEAAHAREHAGPEGEPHALDAPPRQDRGREHREHQELLGLSPRPEATPRRRPETDEEERGDREAGPPRPEAGSDCVGRAERRREQRPVDPPDGAHEIARDERGERVRVEKQRRLAVEDVAVRKPSARDPAREAREESLVRRRAARRSESPPRPPPPRRAGRPSRKGPGRGTGRRRLRHERRRAHATAATTSATSHANVSRVGARMGEVAHPPEALGPGAGWAMQKSPSVALSQSNPLGQSADSRLLEFSHKFGEPRVRRLVALLVLIRHEALCRENDRPCIRRHMFVDYFYDNEPIH